MLRIDHLCKSFGTNEVIRELNMEVNDSSVYGLVGVNGAGKSTLLRIIAGVIKPDKGEVKLQGEDLLNDAHLRRKIAFVPEEPYCPSGSTIRSLKVLYESMYDFDSVWFREACNAFELNETKALAGLSKGMKRRAALLLSLACNPDLLLLDEAYDGLEPLARLQVKKMLAERMEEKGMSVILSSHSLRELEEICDSFGILDRGSLVDYGDLLEKKRLVNKYQIAFETEKKEEDFRDMDVLSFTSSGRVCNLLIRGEKEEIVEKINAMNPVLLDVLPVNFEELFMSEVREGRQL